MMPMRALKASADNFAVVFAVGFVLGVIRISFLAPTLNVWRYSGMLAFAECDPGK